MVARLAPIVAVALACGGAPPGRPPVPAPPPLDPRAALVDVPGGDHLQGDPHGEPDEAPRPVTVAAFRLMRTEVTNAQFAAFVAATGHVTDPERSGAGHVWLGAWAIVRGADWRHPHGPRSSIAGLDAHPVVQVSQRDAAAFCAHHGLRLPTDAEWEWAARGRDGRRYVWGDAPPRAPAVYRLGNVGRLEPCCALDDRDGYRLTAPVGSYPAGAAWNGALDLVGNVWEWTASPHPTQAGKVSLRGAGWGNSAWCLRAAYRHANPPDRGLNLVGFRCAL